MNTVKEESHGDFVFTNACIKTELKSQINNPFLQHENPPSQKKKQEKQKLKAEGNKQ